MRGERIALLGVAAIAGCLLWAPAAEAAFPGENGRIAFANETGSGTAIFSVNPDGSGLMQLTSNPDGDDDPAWSADGARIAFTRNVAGQFQPTQVWVMNADGSGQARLTGGDSDCDPAFLPDGRVVFVRATGFCPDGGDIYLRNLDGTEVNLTPASPGDDLTPTSSPDGQTIAFARGNFADTVIFTVSSGGGPQSPVTADHGGGDLLDSSPNFSPDGAMIAFDRCQAGEGCFGPLNIASVPAGGGAVSAVTSNAVSGSDPDACRPAYAPDGTRLVFTRLINSVSNCSPFNADRTELAFVAPTGGAVQASVAGFAPDWQPVPNPGRCFGRTATIVGTPGADKITGTPGDDVIRGRKGNDRIKGKGGDDVICGQRGDDRLFGGKGADILIGGKGSDFLKGGKGRDKLFGGTPGAPNKLTAEDICVAGEHDKTSNCKAPS